MPAKVRTGDRAPKTVLSMKSSLSSRDVIRARVRRRFVPPRPPMRPAARPAPVPRTVPTGTRERAIGVVLGRERATRTSLVAATMSPRSDIGPPSACLRGFGASLGSTPPGPSNSDAVSAPPSTAPGGEATPPVNPALVTSPKKSPITSTALPATKEPTILAKIDIHPPPSTGPPNSILTK